MDGWMDIWIPDSTNYKSTASGANKSSGKSHLVIKAKELIFFKEAIASDVLPVSMFFKFFCGKVFGGGLKPLNIYLVPPLIMLIIISSYYILP